MTIVSGEGDPISALPFEGTVRMLIHRMKYQGNRAAADLLGDMMAARLVDHLEGSEDPVLVPVPMATVRGAAAGLQSGGGIGAGSAAGVASRCARTDWAPAIRHP